MTQSPSTIPDEWTPETQEIGRKIYQIVQKDLDGILPEYLAAVDACPVEDVTPKAVADEKYRFFGFLTGTFDVPEAEEGSESAAFRIARLYYARGAGVVDYLNDIRVFHTRPP